MEEELRTVWLVKKAVNDSTQVQNICWDTRKRTEKEMGHSWKDSMSVFQCCIFSLKSKSIFFSRTVNVTSYTLKNIHIRPGEIVLSTKGLTHKPKDLADPPNSWKQPGVMAHTYNPSTGKVTTGRLVPRTP